jgi:hypothetical protein
MEESPIALDCSAEISEESVVSRELEGEAVILDLKSGTYMGLNQVGTGIWALMQEHGSLQKVFEGLHKEYVVFSEGLESDLLQ